MPAGVASYIVQIIPISADPVTTDVWYVCFALVVLNFLRRTMAYASSIESNLDCLWLRF
jgi:hypothetical protein